MCILYKEGKYNISTLLNNLGLWLMIKPMNLGENIHTKIPNKVGFCIHSFFVVFFELGKMLQKLGLCQFCMESHTATLLAIGYSCYWSDPNYLYWGFMCAAINGWLRTFITKS
jgi:hypothetical protein